MTGWTAENFGHHTRFSGKVKRKFTRIRYDNPASGVIVEGKVRGLAGHSGDYEDWGVHGLIRLQPAADGRGLSFSISPGYASEIPKNLAAGFAG